MQEEMCRRAREERIKRNLIKIEESAKAYREEAEKAKTEEKMQEEMCRRAREERIKRNLIKIEESAKAYRAEAERRHREEAEKAREEAERRRREKVEKARPAAEAAPKGNGICSENLRTRDSGRRGLFFKKFGV